MLHDVGHCFFSHCTETLARESLKGVALELSKLNGGIYSSGDEPKPHELISYAIVTSPYFEKYWEKIREKFISSHELPTTIDFAKPIIGSFISSQKSFLTEILNGPYDVDKLEYLHRDAKSAGLAITYDRERFFQKITLYYDEDDKAWRLVMGVHGIQSVEQMMLNKMMLAPYVYHHQKVLAADALVQDIGRKLLQSANHNSMDVECYIDFLRYTDSDLLGFSSSASDMQLNKLLNALRNRLFPKRCFVLHKDFLKSELDEEKSKVFSELRKKILEDVLTCRSQIADCFRKITGSECDDLDIYITNTTQKAKYRNIAKAAMVLTQDHKLAQLSEHWVMGNWDETYSAKKEFIYFHIASEKIEDGFCAVQAYLKQNFSVSFDEARIRRLVKLREERPMSN